MFTLCDRLLYIPTVLIRSPMERATGNAQIFHRFTNSTVCLKTWQKTGLRRNAICIGQMKSIAVELPCAQLYSYYGFLRFFFIINQSANWERIGESDAPIVVKLQTIIAMWLGWIAIESGFTVTQNRKTPGIAVQGAVNKNTEQGDSGHSIFSYRGRWARPMPPPCPPCSRPRRCRSLHRLKSDDGSSGCGLHESHIWIKMNFHVSNVDI